MDVMRSLTSQGNFLWKWVECGGSGGGGGGVFGVNELVWVMVEQASKRLRLV